LVIRKHAIQFFLFGDGVNHELVHGNQGILIAPLAILKGTCDIDGNPLEWCTTIILVH
jgi:hypothetical protein